MSTAHILILGAIAGATIFLGLPVARMHGLGPNARSGLSALATGILVFLFWDVMTNAVDPIETSLEAHHWGKFTELSVLGAAGFIAGLMSLVYYDAWMKSRADRRSTTLVGPGAAAVDEFVERRRLDLTNPAIRLSFLIAIGIGVHNFAEGLAIGQAAASDEIALATLLVIGFALHNATEGFGIVAPLAGEPNRPSWGFLALLGVIGGGPTLVGTLVGQSFVNDTVSIAFLALAAGSILYVIVQLLRVAQNLGRRTLMYWGLLLGLLLGFATDFVIVAAGA